MDKTESTVLDSISAFAGVRRKKMPQKFYAVRVGLNPGIYYSWDECSAQVTGQRGAVCEPYTCIVSVLEHHRG